MGQWCHQSFVFAAPPKGVLLLLGCAGGAIDEEMAVPFLYSYGVFSLQLANV